MSFFSSHKYESLFYEDLDAIYIGDYMFQKEQDITDEFYWVARDDYDNKIVVSRQAMQDYLADSMVVDSIDDIPVFEPSDFVASL